MSDEKYHRLQIYLKLVIILLGFFLFTFCTQKTEFDTSEYYQIKFYHVESDSQISLIDNYLQKAYLPALHRAGISKVGVFKPHSSDEKYGNLIVVWVPYKSLGEYDVIESKLILEPQYLTDGKEYIDAPHNSPPYSRIETILLKAFSEMPQYGKFNYSSSNSERVYELRSYQSATEKLFQRKVEMFNEGGEVKIFKDLGFNPLFFGEVISGSDMPNLMYMTTFENKDSQSKHWNSFRTSPEWEKLKNVARYDNTVSHIDKYLLYPTDYSDL